MNILHLTNTDISVDSRILKEMHSLAKSNPKFKINGIGVKLKKNIDGEVENFEKLNIDSITLKSKNWLFLPKILMYSFTIFELTMKMFFRSLKIKPVLIHCHDTVVLPLGIILKFITKAKLIYDAHELESNKNSQTKYSGKLTLLFEKIVWPFVDALIVVSPSIQKWYKNNVGQSKCSEVILNSPILVCNDKVVDKLYLRNKFSIPNNSRIFLYIGILGEGRGIDLILEAFKKDKIKSHLVFLGYGKLKENLQALSQKYPNIHVHDIVPHHEVTSIAQSADVGLCLIENVSLSDYYCLPNKLFEYCFSGLPVLASNFPDISEMVTKYNLGKCCALHPENIESVIKEFEVMVELPKINLSSLRDLSWLAQEEKLNLMYGHLLKS